MTFRIESESQVYDWMRILGILSVDFNSYFIEDLYLPFPFDSNLKQFAIHCIRFYDDLHMSPAIAANMIYKNNLFETIYKDGQRILGTEKIDALIEWGYMIPFEREIGFIYDAWFDLLLSPLIKFDNVNNDVPISNDASEHLRAILIKNEVRADVIEVIFEALKHNEASEWDKKVDYICSMRVIYPDSTAKEALYVWASFLLYALNNMKSWHEITQTLEADDLTILQDWMIQRAKALNIPKCETRMDFDLVKQHMAYFFD